jgi:excisionase family DNA binding protein
MPNDLLTLREVALELRVPYSRAAELARTGTIPVIHLGRQVRVSRRQLEDFLSRGGQQLPGGWRRRA